jgi:holliday junction DNA helicase RuvA
MISTITGVVSEKISGSLIIEVSGIGYRVNVSPDAFLKTEEKEKISLFTYLAVRENALELFGFLRKEELVFFELLISVSGIGPKGALKVLSQATPSQLKSALVTGDHSILTKVSGIGEKTAERIILELKNKIGGVSSLEDFEKKASSSDIETMEALVSLGYSQVEAREALKKTGTKTKNINERIKKALKFLGK